MKDKLMKLFRDLMKFGKVETPEGVLIYEGETLVEGTEVYVESESGEIIPAPDGQYGDYKVVDGKIAPAEPEAEPEQEAPVAVEEEEVPNEGEEGNEEGSEDEKDKKIAELEAKIAELEAVIADYKAKEEEAFAAMKPAEAEIKDLQTKGKENGAMKYFK